MAERKKQGIAGLKDVTRGTRRNDRYSTSRFYFEPISIDLENILTVIYMLRSPEDNVVLKAIVSLERYGKKATMNLEELTSLGIFEYIISIVRHGNSLVKRFAIKLLGMLCALEKFRLQILESDTAVATIFSILKEEEDVVMQEFSSLALAHLSSECFAGAKILRIKECADVLFIRLMSTDPDVQKNCLDTMKNLLNVIDGIKYFICSNYFNMKPILKLTGSSYPSIQIASLEVIQQFMAWSTDERVFCAIRDVSGVEMIISIMENSLWPDLHPLALDIILKLSDNPVIVEYLQKAGCLQRLIKLLEICVDIECSEKLLGALARASQTESGRKVLYANGMDKIFAEYLQKEVSKIQEPACLGIANMGQYPPALENIMSINPTICLLDILTNTSKESKLREMASYALSVLSHKDIRFGDDLLRESRFERLLPLLRDTKSLSIETHLNILLILMGISSSQKNRLVIINENLIRTIMDLVQNIDESHLKPASIQIGAMECLSGLVIEESARTLVEELDGAQKIIGCLKNRYASVRQWAALLTIQLSQNINFVKMFIRLNGLQWLIDKKEMRYSAPSWESAIEAIFSAYLPAKFAFTGRLDLHDLTQEGFYILRHQNKLFFILCDLLEIRASPAYPVYVANFETSIRCPSKNTLVSRSRAFKKEVTKRNPQKDDLHNHMIRTNGDDASLGDSLPSHDSFERISSSEIRTIELENYASCPYDPYLPEYLERLRVKLAKQTQDNFRDPHWLGIHPKLIRQRAQILARFVVDEMSGSDPDPVCKDHFLDMHLNDIRYELGTNIIPLGHIKYGSYIERALLFKILADRIGLPCALVRGTYGRAWVEIAIPRINITEQMEMKETQTSFSITPLSSLSSPRITEEDGPWEEEYNDKKRNVCELPCYRSKAKTEGFSYPPLRICFSNAFPSRLLKPNAIVDLIREPGRIFPIDSYEADEYRGSFLYLNSKKQMKCK